MKEEIKEAVAEWHTPTLGIECPHCEEWGDYQDQNEGDGDGWSFRPCESYSRSETHVDSGYPTVFTCKNQECKKQFKVSEVVW